MEVSILPDMPFEVLTKLSTWKTEYGPGIKMVKLGVDGEITLVFRPLTRGEASSISSESGFNPLETENTILESLLLYPDSFDFDDLADKDFNDLVFSIWNTDGFGNSDKFLVELDTQRDLVGSSLDKNMVAYICAAFKVTPDYVNKLTASQIAEHLAYSETILGVEFPAESKERANLKMQDPRYAVAAMRQQKQIRNQEAKDRRWAERMGIPDVQHNPATAQAPASAGVTADGKLKIDTEAENEALFKARPDLRWNANG